MSYGNGTLMEAPKRKYQQSHSWLSFELDLRKASHGFWMNLGAIQSKCEHVANVMLPPEEAKRLYELYLAKGVRATTAIEGNTLTEEEVRDRIAKKKSLPKSREYLGKEIDNVIAACNLIADQMIKDGDDCKITIERIKQFNAFVLKDLPVDEGVVAGEIARHSVVVGNYLGAPREDCEFLLQKMCEWINSLKPADEHHQIAFGVLRAVMAHLYLAWIHPFGDGNGRTARLIEVQILIGAGVPQVAAHLLSNFYNQTRTEYYRQLSASSKSGGNVLPFLEYAVQGLVDKLDLQIRRIRRYQRAIAWKDYVYEKFRALKSRAAHRQRLLALHLRRDGKERRWVHVSKIRVLTPELAAEYAGRTRKTVSRDLNVLENMGLVRRLGSTQVSANVEALTNFITPRRDESQRE
ncbi:MAG: Fic family protein [Planctomycetes bacterium]|nr:Fic family protein [Planctomycetota bacterium]